VRVRERESMLALLQKRPSKIEWRWFSVACYIKEYRRRRLQIIRKAYTISKFKEFKNAYFEILIFNRLIFLELYFADMSVS